MAAANSVAEQLISQLDNGNMQDIDRCIYKIGDNFAGNKNIECLIGIAGQIPILRIFHWFDNGKDVMNTPIVGRIQAGDISNPALF